MKLSKNNEKKISDFFKNKPEIAAVYLYGSYAKNTARKDSDIDIAVLVRDRKSFNGFDIPQTRYLYDLSRLLKSEVEVVDLEHSPIDFAYRVISEGKLLLGLESEKRVKYEESILQRYFDMKPAIDEYFYQLRQIAKKGDLGARYI